MLADAGRCNHRPRRRIAAAHTPPRRPQLPSQSLFLQQRRRQSPTRPGCSARAARTQPEPLSLAAQKQETPAFVQPNRALQLAKARCGRLRCVPWPSCSTILVLGTPETSSPITLLFRCVPRFSYIATISRTLWVNSSSPCLWATTTLAGVS
ncbi:hypothetical protein K505DRAFT_11386 [Melanomma pulvis-pyrius CBS 109.77]|uniref:Uncharacterized protein n=1 Tax=Melanomma pulvis-pyrius CBS 109.77 TaxID=1314802 RepID=A0A6A6WN79_9PLEO|nr:hypothetical protein K505DRAFT_11386 [Melanomma pulvis-pyrius CBS 109.77]